MNGIHMLVYFVMVAAFVGLLIHESPSHPRTDREETLDDRTHAA